MSSKTTNEVGSIYTALKSLAALDSGYSITCFLVIVNFALYFAGFQVAFSIDDLSHHNIKAIGAMFSHASLGHVMGNMLFLLLAGPFVEKRLGGTKFLLTYLFSGILSGLGFVLVNPDSSCLGASGAIAGVVMLLPFCARPIIYSLLLTAPLCCYFVSEFFGFINQMTNPLAQIFDRVAHIAHVAGAVGGLISFGICSYFND